MTTAYIIHNSEGVPVRRLLNTGEDARKLAAILDTYNDPDWVKPSYGTKNIYIGKYSEENEKQHHLHTRLMMQKQYGYRFEIYWPLSTIFS